MFNLMFWWSDTVKSMWCLPVYSWHQVASSLKQKATLGCFQSHWSRRCISRLQDLWLCREHPPQTRKANMPPPNSLWCPLPFLKIPDVHTAARNCKIPRVQYWACTVKTITGSIMGCDRKGQARKSFSANGNPSIHGDAPLDSSQCLELWELNVQRAMKFKGALTRRGNWIKCSFSSLPALGPLLAEEGGNILWQMPPLLWLFVYAGFLQPQHHLSRKEKSTAEGKRSGRKSASTGTFLWQVVGYNPVTFADKMCEWWLPRLSLCEKLN